MTANEKASTSLMWLKQMTTNTFSTISHKIDRIAFLRRHKKPLTVVLLLWMVMIPAAHMAFGTMAERQLDDYLQKEAAAVERLAEESGPSLLEDDSLAMNRRVADFARSHQALFTAILDYKNMVVAHSDPQQKNWTYQALTGETRLLTIGEVTVDRGRLADGRQAAVFTHAITFSGVRIGSAVSGVSGATIDAIGNRIRRYETIFLITLVMLTGAGAVLTRRRSAPPKVNTPPGTMDGATIGPYRLHEKIAQGGMAELYKADYVREDGFKRTMAVKRVLPHLAENQDFIDMFIREARLAALLQHPNIVQIFDFGKIQNAYFIAMEYIDGLNLGQIMSRLKTGLPVNMATFIATKISLGLYYSHSRKDDESGQRLGIVHRDISPQNILVSYQGEVKISDFGISKANTEPSLTQAGVIKGKLSYLSPEQALGQAVDHQSDIYALGLVLYEILTASRVYQFDSDIEAIRAIPEREIVPVMQIRPDVPEELAQIISTCLQKDKRLRYADASALHAELTAFKIRMHLPFDSSDLSNFMRKTFTHAQDSDQR